MIKFLLITNICLLISVQQILPQIKIDFHSPSNIRLFADYLFCQEDYLRAYDEYNSFLNLVYNDTVDFKAGLAQQMTGDYDGALSRFGRIPQKSQFYTDAENEYARTLFLKKDYSDLRNIFMQTDPAKSSYPFLNRLDMITYFYSDEKLPPEDPFISVFQGSERSFIKKFYKLKGDPPHKSPLLAGILSAAVPGLGKVYTENYIDGLFAALLTGITGYIAYMNFKADHQTRGWIFTGAAAFFYAGSIYGSAASAQIYNARIRFDFEKELHDFLDVFHYLSGSYNFCK
jgi:tetratricopeptide (TPR) repeat protein